MQKIEVIGDKTFLIEQLYNDQINNRESFTYHNVFVKRGDWK